MAETSTGLILKNRCPHCGQVAEISPDMVGEVIECPNPACDHLFSVTLAEGEAVDTDEPATDGEVARKVEGGYRATPSGETNLFVVHPAIVRQRPLQALIVAATGTLGLVALVVWAAEKMNFVQRVPLSIPPFLLLAIACVTLIASAGVLAWWWLVSLFTTVTVTDKRVTYCEGIISRDTSEVQHNDVRNLQIDQGIIDRLLGVGTIAISSSGQDDMEIIAEGIPEPERIAEVIRKYE